MGEPEPKAQQVWCNVAMCRCVDNCKEQCAWVKPTQQRKGNTHDD